jgi:hypothetical protein
LERLPNRVIHSKQIPAAHYTGSLIQGYPGYNESVCAGWDWHPPPMIASQL